MHAGVHDAVATRLVDLVAPVHATPAGSSSAECDCGAVEFVPDDPLAGRVQRRIGDRDGVAISQRQVRR